MSTTSMSLVKSVSRHLQTRPALAFIVPIFFTLTGIQLVSLFSRTSNDWVLYDSHYGLWRAYRSITAFVSHPYMLFKRICSHLEGHPSGIGRMRILDGQKYWREAARNRRIFYHKDALPLDDRFDLDSGSSLMRKEYLITYYKPQLLPHYRDPRRVDPDAFELVIPPKVFNIWYGLVYPNRSRPSASRASKILEDFSTQDRLEILRITQLAKKGGAKRPSTDGAYKDMWKTYLKSKGRDIVINFSSY